MPHQAKKDPNDPNRKKKGKGKNDPYNAKYVRQKEAQQEKRAVQGTKKKDVNCKKEQKSKEGQEAQKEE